MKKNTKKIIQDFLIRNFGYKIVGAKKTVKHNDFDSILFFIYNYLFNKKKVVIFDVGANKGQTIKRFQKVFENNLFFCFEPTKRICQKLKENFLHKKNIKIFNFGISNKVSKIKFFDYKYSSVNSFIPIDKKSKFYKARKEILNIKENEKFLETYNVQITTIDKIVKKLKIDKIDILKIDTQGFEDKVLEGSSQLLKKGKIKVIELELILGFGYTKSLSFFDIEKILTKYKYKLIAISTAGNVISYSNYQTDLIYVSSDVFKKIQYLHYKNVSIKDVMNKTDAINPHSY